MGGVSALVFTGAVAAGNYATLARFAGSVRRVDVAGLTAAGGHGVLAGGAETVLLTSQDAAPASAPGDRQQPATGLIMLLRISGNRKAGEVVSIPPTAVVQVPGHGTAEIGNTVALGGPSLLVRTVEQITQVQISHFARIDLQHLANVVDAIGGVDVRLPGAATSTVTSYGQGLPAGYGHLGGAAAIRYVRQSSPTAQEYAVRQQSLIRAVARKITAQHLFSEPASAFRVLRALTGLLTVDSDFTSGQVVSLARELAGMGSPSEIFVTAPATTVGQKAFLSAVICPRLWSAIRRDSVAAFAAHYPATVMSGTAP